MTAAVIALAVALIAVCVAATLALRWGMRAKDAEMGAVQSESAEHIEHGETRLRLERAEYERDKFRDYADDERKRADKLEKELHDALARNPLGAGLADDDVDGRLLRLASEAGSAAHGVPAQPGGVVPVGAATVETITGAVHRHIDVLK